MNFSQKKSHHANKKHNTSCILAQNHFSSLKIRKKQRGRILFENPKSRIVPKMTLIFNFNPNRFVETLMDRPFQLI